MMSRMINPLVVILGKKSQAEEDQEVEPPVNDADFPTIQEAAQMARGIKRVQKPKVKKSGVYQHITYVLLVL